MPHKTIQQACQEIGISIKTYYYRLKKGMSKEQALTTPLMRSGRKKQIHKVHNSCVWEDDHRENRNKRYKTYEQVSISQKKHIGPVFEDEVERVYPKIKIYSNADFNNALGGYRISILNHIKEGEFRFQIIKLGEEKPFYTNNFQQFSQEINRILTLIRG